MARSIDEIINDKKVFYCVECGKCVAVCPMVEVYQEFAYELSPRGINKRALLGFDVLDILKDKKIWFCLGCTVCTEICPAGVKYAEFIESLRLLAIKEGNIDYCVKCKRCGDYFIPTPILDNMRGALEEMKVDSQFLNLCPECRRRNFAGKLGTVYGNMVSSDGKPAIGGSKKDDNIGRVS